MWWDTGEFSKIWNTFQLTDLHQTMRKFPGDQDYLSSVIEPQRLRFFDSTRVKSWRWQCLDGGYDFKHRRWKTPGSGTDVKDGTAILIFHGNPKPDQTQDPVIVQHWR
jgi:hypothetical protein